MKKDAYYFPHFSNARNDAKILKLRRILGVEGYGIYFMLLEVLREQTEYKLPLTAVEDLEFEFRVSKEKILTVIHSYELFDIIDNHFFSPKLVLFLQPYIEATERGRNAALARWKKINDANAYANADANAMQGEERRGEEIKESINSAEAPQKKKFVKPESSDLINYFTHLGLDDFTAMGQADKFLNYYESNGWRVGRNPMKDWKAACRNWKANMKQQPEEIKPKRLVL